MEQSVSGWGLVAFSERRTHESIEFPSSTPPQAAPTGGRLMPRKKYHRDRVYQIVGEPGPGTHVAGYVRYSSELQDPVTITTQKRKIQEYCALRGWIIIRWYEEPERSAKYEDIEQRPAFTLLLEEAGVDFQVAICYMSDRWARNVPVAFISLSQLRRKRIWWATADGMW